MIADTPTHLVLRLDTTAEHQILTHPQWPVTVNVSKFCGTTGVTEWHISVVPETPGTLDEHLAQVENGYQLALDVTGLDLSTAVWRRFFCSDMANQASILQSHPFSNTNCPDVPCSISHVGQIPLASAKLALWACHVVDPKAPLKKSHDGTTLVLDRGDLRHLWSTGIVQPDHETVARQTHAVFSDYVDRLSVHGLTLADHVVRTWLFQPNIDLDYAGMVVTRREFFADHGLTADTHFIASTGIAGNHDHPMTRVFLDAYAIGGLRDDQVNYLTALDHLGPTYDYGVTFERATSIAYRDRLQIFISGTASIDPSGKIVHPDDVVRQLDRTLNNIDGLLAAAGAGLADMLVFLVYLRDPTDHALVLPVLRERLGNVPILVLAAAVCRPGWLIEIEGVATVAADHPEMPTF